MADGQLLTGQYVPHSLLYGATVRSGPGPPHSRGVHTTAHYIQQDSSWTSDQLVADTSARQHTTLTTEKHPCPR